MADTEELLTLQILQEQLEQAQLHKVEAHIQKLQRGLAYQEQEQEAELSQEQRDQAREDRAKEVEWDKERRRPSMFLPTDVFFDEEKEKFGCQHSGVIAYGDTPAMACENFDHIWVYGK
jgi:hypothetical protein